MQAKLRSAPHDAKAGLQAGCPADEVMHMPEPAGGSLTLDAAQDDATLQRKGDDGAEPSCETGFGAQRVGEVFKLYASTPAQPASLSSAMIGRRTHDVLYSRFYFVGDLLDNEWEIVEITNTHVVVINFTCGTEEILAFEAGEPGPQHNVSVPDSSFGPGLAQLYDNCKRVVFVPDKSKPAHTYTLETWRKPGLEPLVVYVRQDGDRTPYPPPDLERLLRVHLIGDKCGTPMAPPAPPAEEPFE